MYFEYFKNRKYLKPCGILDTKMEINIFDPKYKRIENP